MIKSQILNIATDTVRQAIRSHILICVALIISICVTGITLSANSDSLLRGQLLIILRYSFGIAIVIMGIVSLWVSCGAVSREIDDKRIQVVIVKPVGKFDVWLGKWLGIMSINTVFLIALIASVYCVCRLREKFYAGNEAELRKATTHVLTARQSLYCDEPDFKKKALARITTMKTHGELPSEIGETQLLRQIMQKLRFRYYTVLPGESGKWVFPVPEKHLLEKSGYFSVDFSFRTPGINRTRANGSWIVSSPVSGNSFTFNIEDYVRGTYSFDIPVEVFAETVTSKGPSFISLVYKNSDAPDASTVIFDPGKGVRLKVKSGSFEGNLFRAGVILLCQLGLITAIGLTAGICFSFPVATFFAVSCMFVFFLADYFTFSMTGEFKHHHGPIVEPTMIEKGADQFARWVSAALSPVTRLDTIEKVSDGFYISWRFTIKAVFLVGFLLPFCMAAIGVIIFQRKEFT